MPALILIAGGHKMLKGCKRNIIMVKDTGSEYFDSAYFVLRSDLPAFCKESDMIAEARRMIEGADQCPPAAVPPKKTTKHNAVGIVFPCLAVLGVVAAVILMLIL